MHGTNITNAMTIGNKTVQENNINWSKRILGKDALAHIKTKIIIQVFNPKVIPLNIPSNKGSVNNNNKFSLSILSI